MRDLPPMSLDARHSNLLIVNVILPSASAVRYGRRNIIAAVPIMPPSN